MGYAAEVARDNTNQTSADPADSPQVIESVQNTRGAFEMFYPSPGFAEDDYLVFPLFTLVI